MADAKPIAQITRSKVRNNFALNFVKYLLHGKKNISHRLG
jgi:hypothetical protein